MEMMVYRVENNTYKLSVHKNIEAQGLLVEREYNVKN